MDRVTELNHKYQRMMGTREQLIRQTETINSEIERCKALNNHLLSAQAVIREIADHARQEFKAEVDRLVTLAIRSVFTEDFTFDLQMSTDSGRLQCKPIVWETIDGELIEYSPKDDMGGSLLDPIGFALRVVLHQFQAQPARSMFLLDEPMKNLGHGELLDQAGQMLIEISHSLKLQLIIITHEPELIEMADCAWHVSRNARGESKVEKAEQ